MDRETQARICSSFIPAPWHGVDGRSQFLQARHERQGKESETGLPNRGRAISAAPGQITPVDRLAERIESVPGQGLVIAEEVSKTLLGSIALNIDEIAEVHLGKTVQDLRLTPVLAQ